MLALKVAPGEAVRKGQPLLVLESMKLEHAISAPRDGVIAQMYVELIAECAGAMIDAALEVKARLR